MKCKWLWPVIIVLLAASVLAYFQLNRPRLSDKEQIEQVIMELKSAVENKNSAKALSYISKDYSDSTGANYRRLQALSARLRQTMTERIRVDLPNYEEPQIEGKTAQVELAVAISLLDQGNALMEVQGPVELTFRKERKEWKIIKAEGWHGWAEGPY